MREPLGAIPVASVERAAGSVASGALRVVGARPSRDHDRVARVRVGEATSAAQKIGEPQRGVGRAGPGLCRERVTSRDHVGDRERVSLGDELRERGSVWSAAAPELGAQAQHAALGGSRDTRVGHLAHDAVVDRQRVRGIGELVLAGARRGEQRLGRRGLGVLDRRDRGARVVRREPVGNAGVRDGRERQQHDDDATRSLHRDGMPSARSFLWRFVRSMPSACAVREMFHSNSASRMRMNSLSTSSRNSRRLLPA